MSEPIVSLKNVSKSFYDQVKINIIDNATHDFHKGESVAIVGPSGTGKSTLLNLLAGIEPVDSGLITVLGEKVSKQRAPLLLQSHIGILFQAFYLFEEATVLENVLMPAHIARKKTGKGSPHYLRAINLLTSVGLEERAHGGIKHLSGGEKQRVALARALCNNPSVLLADEPTGNLDPVHGEIIQQLLLDIAKKDGKTVIIVTHNHDFARQCDRVIHLNNGQLCT